MELVVVMMGMMKKIMALTQEEEVQIPINIRIFTKIILGCQLEASQLYLSNLVLAASIYHHIDIRRLILLQVKSI